MMDLDPISEVFEEEFEDCPESVHRLIACLREANEKVKQLSYIEEEVKINQAKQEHLQLLCAEGSAEIEALQQNIAHLSGKVQAKDQELAALLQVNSEFKQLYREHQDCEGRLQELESDDSATGEYELQAKPIKLHKLALKDRMEQMIRAKAPATN